MFRKLKVTNVEFVGATEADIRTGLLGYVSCVVNGSLALDGIAVRQTSDGHLTLSFPARRDWLGRQRFPVRPFDDRARLEIERQIFRALGLEATR